MLKYRAISFPLLLALLAAIFFWPAGGKYLFLVFAPLAAATAICECCRMIGRLDLPVYPKIGFAAALILTFAVCAAAVKTDENFLSCLGDGAVNGFDMLKVVLISLFAVQWLAVISKKRDIILGVLITLSVVCSLGALYALSIVLYPHMVGKSFCQGGGVSLLLIVILITKAMDTGGYIFGMLSAKLLPGGNHKIVPLISPKKSWEGFAGGLLLSLAVAYMFYRCCGEYGPEFYLVLGAALAVGSFLGDITESALKRCCDIKDSGAFIPGMGGAFDVMDSLIYSGIICAVVSKIML